MEQLEHSDTDDGSVNWYSQVQNCLVVSLKAEYKCISKINAHWKISARMFIVVPFVALETTENPSTVGLINILWCINTVKDYIVMRMKHDYTQCD